MDATHYLEQFNNRVDILERRGAALGENAGTMCKVFEQEGIDPLTADEEQLQLVRAKAREWYLALAFLMGADCTHFGQFLETYKNDFTQGLDLLHVLNMLRKMTSSTWMAGKGSNTLPRTRNS